MRVNMLRYTIARESPSDVFAPEAGGTYQLGDFDCIADPVTLIAKPRGNYASEYEARLALSRTCRAGPPRRNWSTGYRCRSLRGIRVGGSPPPAGWRRTLTELVVFDCRPWPPLGLRDPDQGDRGPPRPDPHWHGESPLARDLRLRARALADNSSRPAVACAMYDGIKAKNGGPGLGRCFAGCEHGSAGAGEQAVGRSEDRKLTNPTTLSDEQRAWLLQAMRARARRVAEVEPGFQHCRP